jgi:hypothetical protein
MSHSQAKVRITFFGSLDICVQYLSKFSFLHRLQAAGKKLKTGLQYVHSLFAQPMLRAHNSEKNSDGIPSGRKFQMRLASTSDGKNRDAKRISSNVHRNGLSSSC